MSAADVAPSVEDAQTAPTAAQLLPQVLALTPRGAAYGTDEAGSPDGVSPVMAQYWTAVSAWVADLNVREAQVFEQAFPSLVSIALEDWERDLGLPDPGASLGTTLEARRAMVRIRARGLHVASPGEMIRLALAGGAAIEIEEPDEFRIGASELGPSFDDPTADPLDLSQVDMISAQDGAAIWIVSVLDAGGFSGKAELGRALQPFRPLHTNMVIA